MKFEYEEFSSIEDLFLYMASIHSLYETNITNNILQRLFIFYCSNLTTFDGDINDGLCQEGNVYRLI